MKKPTSYLLIIILILVIIFVFPWRVIKWGSIQLSSPRTITVMGEATDFQENQLANFYAGFEAVGHDKQEVVNQVNNQVRDVLDQLRNFGIEDQDIQTSNVSIYQDTYSDNSRLGEWRASNSITIVMRDLERVGELSELLTGSGLNSVNGPTFLLDDQTVASSELLAEAVANARDKALVIAEKNGFRLGKVVSIKEGSPDQVQPVIGMRDMALGGGSSDSLMPGQTLTSAVATVVFEIFK